MARAATEISLGSRLREVGPLGIAAAILIVAANLTIAPLGAIIVLAWRWIVGVSWRDLGFRAPRSWILTLIIGFAGGILFKLLMKALVIPLLGGPDINVAYHFVEGNRPALIQMILTSVIAGGFGEEILYRGFLFERLERALGKSAASKIAFVLLTTALFASIHIPEQGPYGAVQAAFTGLTFATVYAVTRSLWLPIILHAAFDVTAVVMIYLGMESAVAHSILG